MKSPNLVQTRILQAASFLWGICFARSHFYPEDWPILHAFPVAVWLLAIGVEHVFRWVNRPMMGVLLLLGMAWGSLRFQSLQSAALKPRSVVLTALCLEPLNESKATYLVQVEGMKTPLRLRLKEGYLQPGCMFLLSPDQIKPLRCRGHEPSRFCYARWSLDHEQFYAVYINRSIAIIGRQELPMLYRFRKAIRNRLSRRTSASVRPWAMALVLGDKGQFESQEIKRVQDFGLMHVLAISGLHVGMFFQCLKWILRLLPLGMRWVRVGEVILLLLVWGYAAICHMVPSVLRASLFVTWFVLGRTILQRPAEARFVWPISLLVQLVIRPQDAFDMGFQLSYAATAALIYMVPLFPFKNKGARLILVSMVCVLVTFPILVFVNTSFSLGFWVGAIFLAPLLGLLIPLFWVGLFLPPNFYWMENKAMRVFLFLWERVPSEIIQYWQLRSISVYQVYCLEIALVYFISRMPKLFSNSST
jgi:ComEC/Rec2-related protein